MRGISPSRLRRLACFLRSPPGRMSKILRYTTRIAPRASARIPIRLIAPSPCTPLSGIALITVTGHSVSFPGTEHPEHRHRPHVVTSVSMPAFLVASLARKPLIVTTFAFLDHVWRVTVTDHRAGRPRFNRPAHHDPRLHPQRRRKTRSAGSSAVPELWCLRSKSDLSGRIRPRTNGAPGSVR